MAWQWLKRPGRAVLLCSLASATVSASVPSIKHGMSYPSGLLSGMKTCPESIETRGENKSNWTVVHDLATFIECPGTKLLDFPLYTSISDPSTETYIRTVTSDRGDGADFEGLDVPDASDDDWVLHQEVPFHVRQSGQTGERGLSGQVFIAAAELRAYLALHPEADDPTHLYSFLGKSAVGMYIGRRTHTPMAAIAGLSTFISHIRTTGAGETLVMQYCGEATTGGTAVGIISSTAGGVEALEVVQKAVRTWDEGKCVTDFEQTETVNNLMFWIQPPRVGYPTISTSSSSGRRHASGHLFDRQATCAETLVEDGGNCDILKTTCGNKDLDEFYKNNAGINCTGLMPGQRVCCTPGGLASRRQAPTADGTCATYTVVEHDNCNKIAVDFDITVEELQKFNDGTTWGWKGCELMIDTVVCVSEGDPPLPKPDPQAVCGPRAARGVSNVRKGTNLADLNPCPLNACCSQWGFCGTTDEFCGVKNDGGNPGTGGCISNCGTTIVNNEEPPEQFIKIAYFEGWNQERDCLTMDVREIPRLNRYTHIHFAFPRLTESFNIDVSFMQSQFDRFKDLGGIKKVVSFGGWVDSTAPDRYKVFRDAVLEGNRDKVIGNLVDFVTSNGLDGLDIDWEYPAAPDIVTFDPPDPKEGDTYLAFLKELRARLPSGISLSIASPASQWYLQGFPIAQIAEVVDYIVYMTYDFHGQWDYGKQYSVDGCPSGDCLRSHVNITETMAALTLITKAGVKANKVIVGVSSYGRSFRMVEPGCDGPMCRYVGPESGARAGLCTGEPGYISNAEIDMIIQDPSRNARTWLDADSMSNMLVYDDVEWVAYMDEDQKESRTLLYQYYNFGGTTDWAADLMSFSEAEFITANIFAQKSKHGGRCPWRNTEGYHCDQLASVNTTLPGVVRWRDRACDCAWADFLLEWGKERERPSKMTFSRAAAAFFKAGEGDWVCNNVRQGCASDSMVCPEVHVSNMTGPAGALIMSSFRHVSGYTIALYDGIRSAEDETTAEYDLFYRTFVELEESDKLRNLYLTVDAIGILFSIFSAPIFNNLLKPKGVLSDRAFDNTKDMTYNLAGWGGSLFKDASKAEPDGNVDTVELAADLADITKEWRLGIEAVTEGLFSGNDTELEYFYEIISDGKHVLQGRSQQELDDDWVNDVEANRRWGERVIYSAMIPNAWYAGERSPVILDTGKGCKDTGYLVNDMISQATADKARVCYEDRLYYLVSPAFHWESRSQSPDLCFPGEPGGLHVCWEPGRPAENFFQPLPGSDDLRKKENRWGGITLDDMVAGSLNSRKVNGGKNGAAAFILDSADDFKRLYDNNGEPINIRAPGIFRIPICSPDEAMSGWESAKDHKSDEDKDDPEARRYWPCKKT